MGLVKGVLRDLGEGGSFSMYTCTSSLDCGMARRLLDLSVGVMSRSRLVLRRRKKTDDICYFMFNTIVRY